MPWNFLAAAITLGCCLISPLFAPLARAQHSGLACLEEMELPRFAASNEVSQGFARAWVTLGPEGMISDLELSATAKGIDLELDYLLRNRAKYRKDCAGEKFELVFEFRVEGEETHTPVIRTYFRPPNGFLIVTQPLKMTIDMITAPPRREEKQPKRKQ